jgi:LysM repeat protein
VRNLLQKNLQKRNHLQLKHVEKEDATESAETAPSSATAAADGSSIVVQSGEGAGSIAARAGISVDELERLNPDHMTSGYWYANPGDVVNVQ